MSQDLTGRRFGRLTVIREVSQNERIGGKDARRRSQWLCKCDCEKTVIVCRINLTGHRTQSCGCIKHEQLICNNPFLTHGLTRREPDGRQPRLYRIWKDMKQRCYYCKSRQFQNYGGRGIAICDEWKNSFETFHNWAISNGYDDNLSIDRIDVDGDYTPDNCRWATAKQQAQNTRRSKRKRAREQLANQL